jgi:hypothetical protein
MSLANERLALRFSLPARNRNVISLIVIAAEAVPKQVRVEFV